MQRGSKSELWPYFKKPLFWISALIYSTNICSMPVCSQMRETQLPLAVKELRVWCGRWGQVATNTDPGKAQFRGTGRPGKGSQICTPESLLANQLSLLSFSSPPHLANQNPARPTPASIPPAAPAHLIPAESDLGWSPFTPRCSQKVLCLQGLWEIPSFLPA